MSEDVPAGGQTEDARIRAIIKVQGEGVEYTTAQFRALEQAMDRTVNVARQTSSSIREITFTKKEGQPMQVAMQGVKDYGEEVKKAKTFMDAAKGAAGDWAKSLFGVAEGAGAADIKLAILIKAVELLIKTFMGAVNAAADFEWQMTRVGIVAGDAVAGIESNMQSMKDAVWDAATSSVLQMRDVTEIMYEFAAAGRWTAEEINDATQAITNLGMATGQLENLDDVAKLVGTSMHMFGAQVEDVTMLVDIMAKAVNDSALSVNDIAIAFRYVGPIAVMAEQELTQVAAALTVLSNQGFAASQAGRYLRQVYTYLADRTPETEKALRRLGVEAFDSSGNFRQLGDIVHDLTLAMEGLTPEERTGLLIRGFGVWAGSALAALVNAEREAIATGNEMTDSLNAVADAIYQPGEAARRSAELMGTMRGQQQKFHTQIKELTTTLGEKATPGMTRFYQAMNRILEMESVQDLIEGLGDVFGVLGDAIAFSAESLERMVAIWDALDIDLKDILTPGVGRGGISREQRDSLFEGIAEFAGGAGRGGGAGYVQTINVFATGATHALGSTIAKELRYQGGLG